MRSKKQLVASMKYLAKCYDYLSFRETVNEICLYRNDVSFHGTVMKLTKNGKFWNVLDLSANRLNREL